jgi:dUTP pyrophosphatase
MSSSLFSSVAVRSSSSISSSGVMAAAAAAVIHEKNGNRGISSAVSTTNSFYTQLPLYVQRLSEHAILPSRGSEYAAGLDLSAAESTIVPGNGGRALVATDLRMACPPGTYLRIAPRSGLAYKYGIDVGAGVIDADYRGPVGVILFNFSPQDFVVNRGDRIAQAILEQICIPGPIVDVPISETLPVIGTRGSDGFGSTGVAATTTIGSTSSTDVMDTTDMDDTPSNKKSRTTSTATTISPSTSNDDDNTNNIDQEGVDAAETEEK